MGKPIAITAAVLSIALAWYLWNSRPSADSDSDSATAATVTSERAASLESPSTLPVGNAGGAKRDSLSGTDIDGALHLDAAGNAIADRDLRRLFDYFLARIGEQTPEQIRSALLEHLQAAYPTKTVAQAMRWFDAYVALEQEATGLAQKGGDPREAVARLRELRRARMGADIAAAWWGEEDRHLDNTLARQDILADKTLTQAQRESRLAELNAQLAPQERELREQADTMDMAIAQSRDFAERGVPPAERFAEREKLFGPEAAQRLAALDEKHAQWQDRLRTYGAQRQRVLSDPALTPAQREQRLSALLARFDVNERRRVDALTRNNLLPGQ